MADILATVRPLDPIELPLLDAQGCVLVEDVTVPAALPPFDNSSMDGYAVRVADVAGATEEFPAVLTVVGDVAAGAGGLPEVGPGQAARIMTGAPLPPGAEAVVPVEWTDGGAGEGSATGMRAASTAPEGAAGEVRVHRAAEAGAHVRRGGGGGGPRLLAPAPRPRRGPPPHRRGPALARGPV
ncbi:molybdopterin molybdenumtransferase MoeA, partial [Streptomyces sp. NPDC127049]